MKLPVPWKQPLLKTLDRYVLKRFFSIYVANLTSFTLIYVLIDTIGKLDNFARKDDTFWGFLGIWWRYYSAMTPVVFCQILGPVVAVSAALFAVTTLQHSNEFTPILATGRSHQRTLLPIIAGSLAVSVGVFLVQEVWIPRTVSGIREAVESREKDGVEKNLKHFDRAQGNLIIFREYRRLTRKATGVLVLPVAPRGGHQFLLQAEDAEWRGGGGRGYWLLRDGWVQEWDEDLRLVIHPPAPGWSGGVPRLYERFVELKLETSLIPQDLEGEETLQMTLAQIRRKAEQSPDQSVWTIRYWSRFAYAATNFTLILLGLPVIVYFANRNLLFGAILAVAVATAYFVCNSVCQDLGIQGHLPAVLGAGLAPILFISIGATLYRHMRS